MVRSFTRCIVFVCVLNLAGSTYSDDVPPRAGQSPQQLYEGVSSGVKQLLDGGGKFEDKAKDGSEVSYTPTGQGELLSGALLERARQAKAQHDKLKQAVTSAGRSAEQYKDSPARIGGKPAGQHFEEQRQAAQKELEEFEKENGGLVELLKDHERAQERLRRWRQLLQKLQSAAGGDQWNNAWTPSSARAAADLERTAAELIKQLRDAAEKARKDAAEIQRLANKAADAQNTTTDNPEFSHPYVALARAARRAAAQFDSWAVRLIEAQQKQAREAVRQAQQRYNQERQRLINDAREKGNSNPERFADRRLAASRRALTQAQAALARAERDLAAGRTDAAIRRFSAIMRGAARVRFAALTRPGGRRLALVSPKGTAISLTTLIHEPDVQFVTPAGTQAYAVVEHLAAQGDLGALRRFGEELAATTVDPETAPPETLAAAAEIGRVVGVIDAVNDEVRRQRALLHTRRAEIAQARDDPDRISTLLTTSAPPIAENRTVAIDPASVFQHFLPAMLESGPDPGASVTKGGAVVDAASGAPVAQVTLKFSFSEPGEPEKPAGNEPSAPQSQVVQTEPDGEFQVTVPPGRQVGSVQIGGDNVVTPESSSSTDPALLTLIGKPDSPALRTFTPEQLQQLTPDEQATVLSVPLLVSELWSQTLSGDPDDAARLVELTPEQIAAQAVSSLATTGLLLSGDPEKSITPQTLLDLAATLSDAAREKAPYNGIPETIGSLSPETQQSFRDACLAALKSLNQSGAATLAVNPKPVQVAVEFDGTPEEDLVTQLGNRVRATVQQSAPAADRIDMGRTERKALPLADAWGGPTTIVVYSLVPRQADASPARVNGEVLQQQLTALAREAAGVNFAEVARPSVAEAVTPADPHFSSRGTWGQDYADQWALQRVGFTATDDRAPSAWTADRPLDLTSGETCVVAVIGSGVDWTHRELLGQMWVNKGEDPYNGLDDDGNGYVDDLFGWNFRDNNPDVIDHGGHDTHVAGVIAAAWNQRGIAGVNPHARIMALSVANYLGQANSVDISRAIFYAVDNGARVINISYGGRGATQIEQRAIDYANSHDCLVVVAAGNESTNAGDRGPAGNRGVLAVAGTTADDKRAVFSNWGQPIDLAAPAMDVLSLRARGTDFLLYVGENPEYVAGTGIVGPDRDLYRASGTSFAAPLVSGTASLLFSLRPGLSAPEVRRMLVMSADDVEHAGWDQFSGAGRLNAVKALEADPDHELQARISGIVPVRKGNQVSVQVRGDAAGTEFEGRWLQIGFGASPTEWTTLSFEKTPVSDSGVLATIPMTRFDRRGVWTIRLLVRDKRKTVRGSRAELNLE